MTGADPESLERREPVTKFLKRGGSHPFFNADFSCYHIIPLSIFHKKGRMGGEGPQAPWAPPLNPPLNEFQKLPLKPFIEQIISCTTLLPDLSWRSSSFAPRSSTFEMLFCITSITPRISDFILEIPSFGGTCRNFSGPENLR